MSVDANKKHYFSVLNDRPKVKELMSQIAKDPADIILWKQGQTPEEAETYQTLSYDASSGALTLKAKGILAKFKTSSLVEEKIVLFKGTVEKMQYFSTGCLEYDKATATYTFKLTGDFYASQQRSNYRLKAGKHIVIQFKMDDEVFDCQDISAGGTSFVTDVSNKDRFIKGKIFEGCVLRLNREQFQIPQVKVAGTWDIKDDEENLINIGLGIQFINVTSKLDEDLCRHINSEARAEEIRKTLLKEKVNRPTT